MSCPVPFQCYGGLKQWNRKNSYRAGWSAEQMKKLKNRDFLDVNNAIAYREMQRDAASLTIRLQYIRPEWAKDLHKSRLRQRDEKQER